MNTDAMLLAATIALGIDLAHSAAELTDFLRVHLPQIDQVARLRPKLVDQLRTRAKARRLALPASEELR
jgi:hypothetical protein